MSNIIVPPFGWHPDSPDGRDLNYTLNLLELPDILSVDITYRYKGPTIFDQGLMGSCTANAIAYAMRFALLNHHSTHRLADMIPSRLFIYWNERFMEKSTLRDDGAQIRDGIKSVASLGACNETEWPYGIFRLFKKPNDKCYQDAAKFEALNYFRVDNTNFAQMMDALHSGFPIIFGMTVYTSFISAQALSTGVIPMPDFTKEKPIGGHCMVIIGYDMPSDRYIFANSWGPHYGVRGYGTIPRAYIENLNLCDDFWVIKTTM